MKDYSGLERESIEDWGWEGGKIRVYEIWDGRGV